jgi:hypothetical protein
MVFIPPPLPIQSPLTIFHPHFDCQDWLPSKSAWCDIVSSRVCLSRQPQGDVPGYGRLNSFLTVHGLHLLPFLVYWELQLSPNEFVHCRFWFPHNWSSYAFLLGYGGPSSDHGIARGIFDTFQVQRMRVWVATPWLLDSHGDLIVEHEGVYPLDEVFGRPIPWPRDDPHGGLQRLCSLWGLSIWL